MPLPWTVMSTAPVTGVFSRHPPDTWSVSKDAPSVAEPPCRATVATSRREPIPPGPTDRHLTPESDFHSVLSQLVPAALEAAVYACSPRPDPATVMMVDPVLGTFVRCCPLKPAMSNEKACVTEPVRTPAVTTASRLAPDPDMAHPGRAAQARCPESAAGYRHEQCAGRSTVQSPSRHTPIVRYSSAHGGSTHAGRQDHNGAGKIALYRLTPQRSVGQPLARLTTGPSNAGHSTRRSRAQVASEDSEACSSRAGDVAPSSADKDLIEGHDLRPRSHTLAARDSHGQRPPLSQSRQAPQRGLREPTSRLACGIACSCGDRVSICAQMRADDRHRRRRCEVGSSLHLSDSCAIQGHAFRHGAGLEPGGNDKRHGATRACARHT
eukprot:3941042-Rhodomonas_salina.4